MPLYQEEEEANSYSDGAYLCSKNPVLGWWSYNDSFPVKLRVHGRAQAQAVVGGTGFQVFEASISLKASLRVYGIWLGSGLRSSRLHLQVRRSRLATVPGSRHATVPWSAVRDE